MAGSDLPLGLASLQREAAQSAQKKGRALPPLESWHPAHCGDIDIRIAADGTWFHEGRPIRRPELVRLFSTLLFKDGDGFHLLTPVEKLRIAVDDAPFVAALLRCEGDGPGQRLVFTTNAGDEVTAGAGHPIRVETSFETGEPAPYLHVRNGLEAKIARAVFYQLAEMAVPGTGEHEGSLGVWSQRRFFPLGRG